MDINTSRLLIRHFHPNDYLDLFSYLSNPTIYRFEPGGPITIDQAKDLCISRSKTDDFWAVILTTENRLIGHIYLSQMEPKEWMTWELGYIFHPDYHNQGYATEAAAAVVRHAFTNMGMHRVYAHCNPVNIASVRVLEKIGMRQEGFFRKNSFFHRDPDGNPIWTDTYEYALLAEDMTGSKAID
jgi:RimJ/RimL family protein N-acetyltransferase